MTTKISVFATLLFAPLMTQAENNQLNQNNHTLTVEEVQQSLANPNAAVRPFRVVCITKRSNTAPRKDCADGTTIISTGGAICPNETSITDYEVRIVGKDEPVVPNNIDDSAYKIYDVVRHCTYYVK